MSRSATLVEAASENGWNIRRSGQRRYPHLWDTIAEASWPVATVGPDIALWRHDQDVFKLNFSATETWEVELKRPNSHGIVLYGSLRPYPDNPSWFG